MPSSTSGVGDPAPPIPGAILAPMEVRDVEEVLAIENASFPSPWLRRHFLHEIEENPVAVNRVVRLQGRVAGYACVWQVARELKINNIATRPDLRGQGLGDWLLAMVLRNAARCRCRTAMLEVRVSNRAARALYAKHGFVEVGRRRGYYQREDEDAILMSAELPEVR